MMQPRASMTIVIDPAKTTDTKSSIGFHRFPRTVYAKCFLRVVDAGNESAITSLAIHNRAKRAAFNIALRTVLALTKTEFVIRVICDLPIIAKVRKSMDRSMAVPFDLKIRSREN